MTKFIIISLLVLISISIFMALEPSVEGLESSELLKAIKCEHDINCTDNADVSNSMPGEDYTKTHEQIKQDHDDIIRMRADIDRDLKEISKGENTIYAEKRLNYEKTLYSTLMFTILASSLIYFVFNEL